MRNTKGWIHRPGVMTLLCAVFSMLCFHPASAQTITGNIGGTITDASGAVLANATVKATGVATGVVTATTTNAAGIYTLRFLPIGEYTVTAEAKGFSKSSLGPITLEIDQSAKIDIKLTVGGANETVTVEAGDAPILNTENATLGTTLTSNTIENIALNGRNFAELALFMPGAVSTSPSSFSGSDSTERDTGGDTVPNVNGNRSQSNNFLLDGQDINESINNTVGYTPSPDALDQVRVISANADAEFGNVNGGSVLAVIKSGTNHIHGSGFWYLENDNLDTNTWANKHTTGTPIAKNPYTQGIFGGTIGLPIKKDKLFFFGDYEGFRWHEGGQAFFNVAPQTFRDGDFSALLNLSSPIQLYNTQSASGPVAYANNQVSITNPVATYLFNHTNVYPLPNTTGSGPLGLENNYAGPTKQFKLNNQGDFKIDWTATTKDTVSGRFSISRAGDATSAVPVPVEFPSASDYPSTGFTTTWTHTFSPAIVNSARASYMRIRFDSGVPTDPSGVFGLKGNSIVGISSGTQQVVGFANQAFDGSTNTTTTTSNGVPSAVGDNPTPEIFIDNTFDYGDNLTWQRGHHLFKIGAQFLRYQQNSFYPGNDGEQGQFEYTGSYTGYPGAAGYSFADFVTDGIQNKQIGAVSGRTGQRQWRTAYFVQDDWKLTPTLTINLGVRYEFDQPIYEVNNKEANINFATDTVEYAGVDGASRALYNPTYTNFMPRIGFAKQLGPKAVVRGGYGITGYLEGTGANLRLTQNPPFHTDFENHGVVPSYTGTTYSEGTFYTAESGFPTTVVNPTTFYAWPKNLKPATIQEYSLTGEYALDSVTNVTVGFVGETGIHLVAPGYGNQLLALGDAAPFVNVVGQSGTVKVTESAASMAYDALQASIRRHLTKGLEFNVNYTYAKAMTNDIGYYGVSSIQQQYYQQNYYDIHGDWGPAGEDIRHSLNLTGVYDLPFGRGRQFGANWNRAIDTVAGGWKFGSSAIFYTGFPVTISSPAEYSSLIQAYGGAARPDHLRSLKITHQSINNWFGTDASATACAAGADNGTCAYMLQSTSAFGTSRPSTQRAPGYRQADLSLSKSFTTFREEKFDFRADFFNALNLTSYGNPDNGAADVGFGSITSVRSPNRQIQLALKYSF
jgi:hypothetical protein